MGGSGKLLKLEIVGLVLASAGAVYGIWTQDGGNTRVPIVATVLTLAALLAVATLAIVKTLNDAREGQLAERRRQDSVLAAFAGSELANLQIVWTFATVPEQVSDMVELGRMIVDTNLLRDIELDRSPQSIRSKAMDAWHLESAVGAVLHAIDQGSVDLNNLYDGKLKEAFQLWEDKEKWCDEMGASVSYSGPVPELIFPLNLTLNAAISLGKRQDDVAESEPRLIWQQDWPDLFEHTNYGFRAEVESHDHRLMLKWTYPHASLKRAVMGTDDARLTAGLPREFAFILVREQFNRTSHLTNVVKLFADSGSKFSAAKDAWNAASTMDVYVNGLQDPHYKYSVSHAGTHSETTHVGAYDEPTFEFEYTRFVCRLVSL